MIKKNQKPESQENPELQSESCTCEACSCSVEAREKEAQEGQTAESAESVGPTLEEWEQLQQEKGMLSDQLLRTAAEYDNFRKRTQREKEQLYSDSLVEVTQQWLPLLDNIERGYQVAAQAQGEMQGSSLLEGIDLIRRQAHDILAQLGVEEIPALGETFDPQLHEAVFQVEDLSYGEQEVIEVFQTGYRKGDRVLRHSVVKVAN